MKKQSAVLSRFLLTASAASTALLLSACEKAKETAAQAEAAAKEAAAEARAVVTKAAEEVQDPVPGFKKRAAQAMEEAREAGAGALSKGREMLGGATDWTMEKLGIPENDSLLDGFRSLYAEAQASLKEGLTGEKAAALRARWDELQKKAADSLPRLTPEQQMKFKTIFASLKDRWDALLAKGQARAAELQEKAGGGS